MHRKAIIITSCILGIIAILILLSVLLFGVKEIYVESYPADCTQEEKSVVLDAAAYCKGQNILFVNEQVLTDNISSVVPQLEILGIERKFPSAIAIHVLRKQAYAYVEVENRYLIVDNEMRVLRTEADRPVDLIRLISDPSDIVANAHGHKLSTANGAFERIGASTFYCLARIGYDVGSELDRNLLDLVASIKISAKPDEDARVTILMQSGTEIEIRKADADTELYFKKIRLAMTAYTAHSEYQGEGKKIIAITQDGKALVFAQK